MAVVITIPILSNEGTARWECHDDPMSDETFYTFSDYVYEYADEIIEEFDVKKGDIIIPEDGNRYENAHQLDIGGVAFVPSALDMNDGFTISWEQIPENVVDPILHFNSLLKDIYFSLKLTPNVIYIEGEFIFNDDGDDIIITKDEAYNHYNRFHSTTV